jgi:cardiolipin synthase A/B
MLHRTLPVSLLAAASAAGLAAALAVAAPAASAAADYTLLTEPDQGFSQVYSFINGATKNIDMTMYELDDSTAEQDLAAAAGRGVTVRVILDHREESTNFSAYSYLNSHGVKTVWSSSAYYYTHEKCIVVDDTALIMTANLTSEYYSTSRDFGVFDTDSADVSAIEKVFSAD